MGIFDKLFAIGNVTRERMNEGKGIYSRSDNYRERAFEDKVSNHGWYTCSKCGRKGHKSDMEVDHIIPHSKGGDNSRGNLQILCRHCNRSKGASTSDTRKDLARRSELFDEGIAFLGACWDAYKDLKKKQ